MDLENERKPDEKLTAKQIRDREYRARIKAERSAGTAAKVAAPVIPKEVMEPLGKAFLAAFTPGRMDDERMQTIGQGALVGLSWYGEKRLSSIPEKYAPEVVLGASGAVMVTAVLRKRLEEREEEERKRRGLPPNPPPPPKPSKADANLNAAMGG